MSKEINTIPQEQRALYPTGKLVVKDSDGQHLFLYTDVVCLQADQSQVYVNTRNCFGVQKKRIICTTLKDMEEQLCFYPFMRVHNTWLINIEHLESYLTGKGRRCALMSNGFSVPVSRKYRDAFLAVFERCKNVNQPVLPVSYAQLPVNG